MKKLKLYMGYDRTAGSNSGAFLIFAKDYKEARKEGRRVPPAISGVPRNTLEARWLRKNLEALSKNADPKKLAAGEAHCVVDVAVCPVCELWGEEGPREDGSCGYCALEEWSL
jgi:hypothetical protein